MSVPSLTVAICAYSNDRWDDLQAAVASVLQQDRPAEQILLVIDHNPSLYEMAVRRFPEVTVIASDHPRGLAGARNAAVANAVGDVVAFLDDDAVADPQWTTQLLGGYVDDDVLGVGGDAAPAWEVPPPSWFPEEFLWVVGCSYRGQPTAAAAVRNPLGCNMSVRRDVLRAVGGFDVGLGRTADRPLGCEETELCIRARSAFPTGRFVLEPRARVHHRVPASRVTWQYFRSRCRAEGVSKAWVSTRTGADTALSSERTYALKTLPSGVARNLWRCDAAVVGQAAAIVAGLVFTTSGFIEEQFRLRRAVRKVAPRAASI